MDEELGVSHAFQAGYGKAQEAMAGASIGAHKLVSDLGGMLPSLQSANLHPFIQARHGMYAHEMSFTGDVAAMFGRGIPKTTTAYEYQELAARDFGSRIGTGLTMGAFHGAATAASWTAGTAAISGGYKLGRSVAQASRFATPAMRTGATALARGGMGALGVAGGLVGAGVGIAGMMAFDATVGKVAGDIQDRRDITGFLEASSFRYATGTGEDIDQHFGAGFNRKARGKIASAIKDVDIGDSFYDMDDLKGVLESGTQMGMFSGSQSAEEFSRKFKNLTSTLKKVAKTLHTSLADGMKVIKDLQQQGFGTGADMNSAIMTADVLGTATGRTAAEMLSVGRQGSEMVRGTGIGLSTGSTMMQNTMANVDIMAGTGALSGEMIAQAGGKGQLAQGLMASNVGFMQSAFGRGVMASITDQGGQIDLSAMQDIVRGDASLTDIAQRGAKNMPDPASYIRQVINQEKNMRTAAEQFGDTGMQALALTSTLAMGREYASRADVSVSEGMRFTMKRRGMSESQIEAQMGMIENVDEIRNRRRSAMQITARKARRELLAEKYDVVGRVGDWFDEKLSPISEGVAKTSDQLSEYITGGVRSFEESFYEHSMEAELVDRQSFKKSEVLDLVARGVPDRMKTGKRQKAPGDGREGGGDSSSIFSDEASESFRSTDAFKKLRNRYEGRELSSKANMADSLEDYSMAITEQSFKSLNRNQKMYLETELKRTGRSDIKQELDKRQAHSSQALSNTRIRSVREIMQAKKDAEANVDAARDEIISQFEGKGKGAVAGMPMSSAAYGLRQLVKTKEGREKFDQLVELRTETEEMTREKYLAMSDEEKLEFAKKAQKLTNVKGDIVGLLRSQGMGDYQSQDFLAGMGDDKLKLAPGGSRFKSKNEDLNKITEEAKSASMYESVGNYLQGVEGTGLDSGILGMGGEESEFSEGVNSLREFVMSGGKGKLKVDARKMAKLSSKAGHGALSSIFSRGDSIGKDDPVTDMKRIRKLIDVQGKSDEEVRGLLKGIDGEEGLSREEFFKIATAQELSDRSGSQTQINKGDPTTDLGKKTIETTNSIVEAQEKITKVTTMLFHLNQQIKQMTGKKAF